MSRAISHRLLGLVVLLVLAASACSSDPTEVVIGVSDEADAAADDSLDVDDASVADESDPIEMASTTTTTGVAPLVTTTSEAPQTTDLGNRQTVEVLGPAMVGVGEWVVLRPPSDPEDECASGTLAFRVDGEIVHRYDELSFGGGVRLFNGFRGQDALVFNCEEVVDRVALQGSAILPEGGWPELTVIDLVDHPAFFAFGGDYAWRGDVFTGFGTDLSPGSTGTELYGFDAYDGSVTPLIPRIGELVTVPGQNIDVLLPAEWELRGDDTVHHPFSFSHVQVERTGEPLGEPLAEGDDFLSSDSAMVSLWSRDGDFATTSYAVEATDWTFLTDDGVRVVRHVPAGRDTVVIELFADAGDGTIDRDVPWLVLDTLRIFEN